MYLMNLKNIKKWRNSFEIHSPHDGSDLDKIEVIDWLIDELEKKESVLYAADEYIEECNQGGNAEERAGKRNDLEKTIIKYKEKRHHE